MTGDPELDRLLRARAAALAKPAAPLLTERPAALGLAVGADRVLIPAEAALGVGELARLTPVPFAEPHVAGLTARRGRAIPVFHLRVLLGLPLSQLPETSRIVVLAAPGEPALVVDAVEERDLPAPETLGPAPDLLGADGRRWIRGLTADGWLVLNVDELLASPLLTIDVGPKQPGR